METTDVKTLKKELKRVSATNSDKLMHLSHMKLTTIPQEVFSSNFAHVLRLDVSFNRLECIPIDIKVLASLKQLWVHNNLLLKLQ